MHLGLQAQTDPNREAQARRELDYNNQSNDNPRAQLSDRFADNLWYGGGLQLGFNANTFESFFVIGLSPMVGYKIHPNISFGPRVSVNYNNYRVRNTGNQDFSSGYVTWSAGVFGRARIINPIFIHAEYSLENDVIGFLDSEPVRRTRSVPYLGAGYSQQNFGGASSEFLVLFRLISTESQLVVESPFVVRAGINFNF